MWIIRVCKFFICFCFLVPQNLVYPFFVVFLLLNNVKHIIMQNFETVIFDHYAPKIKTLLTIAWHCFGTGMNVVHSGTQTTSIYGSPSSIVSRACSFGGSTSGWQSGCFQVSRIAVGGKGRLFLMGKRLTHHSRRAA